MGELRPLDEIETSFLIFVSFSVFFFGLGGLRYRLLDEIDGVGVDDDGRRAWFPTQEQESGRLQEHQELWFEVVAAVISRRNQSLWGPAGTRDRMELLEVRVEAVAIPGLTMDRSARWQMPLYLSLHRRWWSVDGRNHRQKIRTVSAKRCDRQLLGRLLDEVE